MDFVSRCARGRIWNPSLRGGDAGGLTVVGADSISARCGRTLFAPTGQHRANQQIKNPPGRPVQQQLSSWQNIIYSQKDRQNRPGLPLGWA